MINAFLLKLNIASAISALTAISIDDEATKIYTEYAIEQLQETLAMLEADRREGNAAGKQSMGLSEH